MTSVFISSDIKYLQKTIEEYLGISEYKNSHLLAITFCCVTCAGKVKRSLNTAVLTIMVAHQGNPDNTRSLGHSLDQGLKEGL